ncbi:MAG: gliding motility-associated C-terminal domain-containing protein, partial [Flavobacteriales bacterium]|nr:gliding motility-associated C-terminal domain-containing protein [Flavobacteriales bacterium]
ATAPCVSDQSTVTVTENAAPDAGTNGTLTLCETGASAALINALGGTPDAGGAWSGPSAVVGGNYDPATMNPGVYTYTLTGTAPCANATATVTVAETGSPDAGTDGTITVCANGTAVDLFAQLGGTPDAGGTWTGPSAVVGGNYDPATMTPGVYTYTLNATAPCAGTTATVSVSEDVLFSAGDDASIQLCAGADPVDLFTSLGASADAGGAWNGPGGPFDGLFDPGSDPGGSYTYSFPPSTCPADAATVQVTVQEGPDAGENNTMVICSDQAAFSLTDQLGGTPDLTGTWTGPDGAVVADLFLPATGQNGVYVHDVPSDGTCPADQAMLTINVNMAPVAGNSGSLAICAASGQASLFDGLSGTLDAGGTWTGPTGQPHGTVIDPATDVSGLYTYTVSGIAPCSNAVSTVAVLIAPIPDAGGDATTTQCSSAAAFVMNVFLSGTPQANGIWRGPSGDVVPATFTPASSTPGVYTYTVEAVEPCPDDVALLTIVVTEAADAGGSASISVCENSASTIDLFSELGGTPDTGGAWAFEDGAPFSGSFQVGVDPAGTYSYTVTGTPPCASVMSTVVVDVVPIPVAGFQVDGAGACTPVTVTLTSDLQGSGTCSWLLWNGEQIDDCAPITRTITQGGTYGVTLIVDAGNGCGVDTLDVPDLFTVYDQPTAAFTHIPEVINTLAPEVRFLNTSTNATTLQWDINGLLSTEESPYHVFPAGVSAEYLVCLTAFASEMCRDSICEVIAVEDGLLVHVPNAFTPDGRGPNDVFRPVVIGVDPTVYRFYIFDRWGQPMFETNDPAAGWDGRFADGTEAPIGVYVWKLVARDRITTNRIERIGHVTLVR